jgi:hypothetical protein
VSRQASHFPHALTRRAGGGMLAPLPMNRAERAQESDNLYAPARDELGAAWI